MKPKKTRKRKFIEYKEVDWAWEWHVEQTLIFKSKYGFVPEGFLMRKFGCSCAYATKLLENVGIRFEVPNGKI